MQTLVQESLREYNVCCADTIAQALKEMNQQNFSAILIDIQLPDGDGLRFLTKISQEKKFKSIPVLILSSHTEISNKVMAFTLGAEDFISKPFDPIELKIRVAAKIKRYQTDQGDSRLQEIGDITIDFNRQKAARLSNGKENDLNLTAIELKILGLLTRRMEQVYSREQIIQNVWGDNTYISDRTVDSHMAHLRTKIEGAQVKIETIKNLGYRAKLTN
ncbi:MAG: response regulator transcription factor [Bdellovibrionaceae bacterium]|nr:response regulator transcription factor [Pseudobdellovibrionaceae bacterium]